MVEMRVLDAFANLLLFFFFGYRADTRMGGEATGALSWAFITSLKKNQQQSYVQLLNSIRDELSGRYQQRPQLSCSHPLSEWSLLCQMCLAVHLLSILV